MTLKLEATTKNSLERIRVWLQTSSEIMNDIEKELEPTDYQKHQVGMEWAGTLSRLR